VRDQIGGIFGLDGRVELVGPGRAVGTAVAVVVAAEVVAAGARAAFGGQGDIDAGEEVFFEVRAEGDYAVEVLLG